MDSKTLHDRRRELLDELASIDRKLEVIDSDHPLGRRDPAIPVPNRVRLLLGAYPHVKLRPAEIAMAIDASLDTVRRALSRLTSCGFVIGAGTAAYGIDPITGSLDHESAVKLRGWID